MKIGQLDSRGKPWTRKRAAALKRAQAGRKKAWKRWKRPATEPRTESRAEKRQQQTAQVAAKHAFKLNVHLAELTRIIVRDELRHIIRGIK